MDPRTREALRKAADQIRILREEKTALEEDKAALETQCASRPKAAEDGKWKAAAAKYKAELSEAKKQHSATVAELKDAHKQALAKQKKEAGEAAAAKKSATVEQNSRLKLEVARLKADLTLARKKQPPAKEQPAAKKGAAKKTAAAPLPTAETGHRTAENCHREVLALLVEKGPPQEEEAEEHDLECVPVTRQNIDREHISRELDEVLMMEGGSSDEEAAETTTVRPALQDAETTVRSAAEIARDDEALLAECDDDDDDDDYEEEQDEEEVPLAVVAARVEEEESLAPEEEPCSSAPMLLDEEEAEDSGGSDEEEVRKATPTRGGGGPADRWVPLLLATTNHASSRLIAKVHTGFRQQPTEAVPKQLLRDSVLAYSRRALRGSLSSVEAAEALTAVPFGTSLYGRGGSRWHWKRSMMTKERSRLEDRDKRRPIDRWAELHVLIELLGCIKKQKAEWAARVVLALAKKHPTFLGLALQHARHAAVSYEAWKRSLPLQAQDQLREAGASHTLPPCSAPEVEPPSKRFKRPALADVDSASSEDEEEEGEEAVIGALYSALCSELGQEDGSTQREAARRRRRPSGDPSSSRDNPADVILRRGLEAWVETRRDTLSERALVLAQELSRDLCSSSNVEEQTRLATALVATSRGEAADAAAAVAWASSLSPTDRAALPLALLRRLAALTSRPVARVINLRGSDDRWRSMLRLGLAQQIAMSRFEASMEGAEDIALEWSSGAMDLNATFDDKSEDSKAAATLVLSGTERGCAQSHVRLWRQISSLKQRKELHLILEDDVLLAPGFAEKYKEASNAVPSDVDVLLLGYFFRAERSCPGQPNTILRQFLLPSYFWGLHAYAITPDAASKLLLNLPVNAPADVFVAQLAHSEKVTVYALREKIAKQRTQATSTVHHTAREDPGVSYNPSKKIAFDTLEDLRNATY